MADDSVLELRGVEKTYGDTRVLGPIDFSVRKGELLTLLGPSGCVKTTTRIERGAMAGQAQRLNNDGLDVPHPAIGQANHP